MTFTCKYSKLNCLLISSTWDTSIFVTTDMCAIWNFTWSWNLGLCSPSHTSDCQGNSWCKQSDPGGWIHHAQPKDLSWRSKFMSGNRESQIRQEGGTKQTCAYPMQSFHIRQRFKLFASSVFPQMPQTVTHKQRDPGGRIHSAQPSQCQRKPPTFYWSHPDLTHLHHS